MSIFDPVALAPPDPIFGLVKAYQTDPRPNKINLLIGFYKTEELTTPVLDCVKKAETILLQNEKHKEYLPIDGNGLFIEKIGLLIFGETFWNTQRIYGAQAVGGTGALRLLGDFFKKEITQEIGVSNPTWPNHPGIFKSAGLQVHQYPYYDRTRHCLVFDKMVEYFNTLKSGSLILFHSNCHNPTGYDLSQEQWKELSHLFRVKNLIPFFDVAYQGFGKGIEEDVWAVRYFFEQGHEMAVAYSCAKSFSLYGERVGALYVVSNTSKNTHQIQSQIKALIRTNYSNPPIHGAAVVATILSSKELIQEWKNDLVQIRKRIMSMRKMLSDALKGARTQRDFGFMERASGLFSYTGLDAKQVERLIAEYGIYLPSDGRINVTGLNKSNLEYVVNAMIKVIPK